MVKETKFFRKQGAKAERMPLISMPSPRPPSYPDAVKKPAGAAPPKDARAKREKGKVTRLARAGRVVVSLVAHRLNDAVNDGDRRVLTKS